MGDGPDLLPEAEGAVPGEVAGRPVARHYGESAAEYRAVREGAGVALRSDRARFRLWGKDPARMLHGLVSNDLLGAAPGRGVYAAMLTPKGRMIADLRAFRRGDGEVLVSVASEARTGVAEQLRKFVPPMFAKWEDASDALLEVGLYGPTSREVLGRVLGGAALPAEEDGFAEVELAGARLLVAATREAGLEEGFDLYVEADRSVALWTALREHAPPVGMDALEMLRVEAGRPRYGCDLTEETIPTEAFESAGLMERAISFTKGCYTGQEVVVRIAHRGHVNRHLRGLLLGDAPAPAFRTPLVSAESGKQVGWTTSAALSPRFGQTIALGYLRREVGPGEVVRVGAGDGPEARVSVLPFGEG